MTPSEVYIEVAIPVPLHHAFTYRVPDPLVAAIRSGMRVTVPFRRRNRIGIVVAIDVAEPQGYQCKDLIALCDDYEVMSAEVLALCQWVSHYYAAPIGEVCRAALPSTLFRKVQVPRAPRLPSAHMTEDDAFAGATCALTAQQRVAVDLILQPLQRGDFQPFLLHGITGSGKTEIYLATIAAALAAHKTAILLLPEIGLTPQLLGQLTKRFGHAIALYHSGLTEAQRFEQWERMRLGHATICCGTRSAVFAPLRKVGCIILDEEHDSSYKQDESPHYHGRDVAVMRAHKAQAVAILGSATPSLESMHNVAQGKYTHLTLTERPSGATLPIIDLIDMRKQPASNDPSGLLSAPLREAIAETMARQEQVILFLNRRGFASMLLCRECGHVFRCPNCDISLTLHKSDASLQCHYCEYAIPRPKRCPSCAYDQLKTLGCGTERIEAALIKHFPAARIARLDRDTSMKRGARQRLLGAMHRGETDILLGTQMITKGHDFSRVTLVGVIQADQSLYLPDFRAAERTFQLLTQVAGRAGRADRPGRVLIQTFTPEHYSLRCAQGHNYQDFLSTERQHREELGYPPFGRLVNIRLSSNVASKVSTYATQLRAALDKAWHGGTTCTLLGPAPSPRQKVAGRHRWQILCKGTDLQRLQAVKQTIREHADAHAPSGVQVSIDVDPLHLM